MGLLVLCWVWLRLMPFYQCKFHVGFWADLMEAKQPTGDVCCIFSREIKRQNTFQQSWKWRIGLYFHVDFPPPTSSGSVFHPFASWSGMVSFIYPFMILLCKWFLLLFIYIYPNLSWRRYLRCMPTGPTYLGKWSDWINEILTIPTFVMRSRCIPPSVPTGSDDLLQLWFQSLPGEGLAELELAVAKFTKLLILLDCLEEAGRRGPWKWRDSWEPLSWSFVLGVFRTL